MNEIVFQGKSYPIALINMPFGERLISTENLNDDLMNSEGSYVSDKARMIDECIFYFVANNHIRMNKTELRNKILAELWFDFNSSYGLNILLDVRKWSKYWKDCE